MPVTITLPQPGTPIGPGFWIDLQSDFIGPIDPASRWIVNIALDPEGANSVIKLFRPYEFNRNFFVLWGPETTLGGDILGWYANDGDQVHVIVELDELGTIIDSGAVTATYKPTQRLGDVVHLDAGGAVNGGFTDTDRQQLADTRNALVTTVTTSRGVVHTDLGSLFNWTAPDFWGSGSLSGGVTCERIDYDASLQNLFGVSLVIEEYPDDVVLRTPDGGWSFPDLAVLSFFRGGILQQRHGIHTLTHTVSPVPSTAWYGALGVQAPVQPADYHIVVDWLPGVCGNLLGFRSPF